MSKKWCPMDGRPIAEDKFRNDRCADDERHVQDIDKPAYRAQKKLDELRETEGIAYKQQEIEKFMKNQFPKKP